MQRKLTTLLTASALASLFAACAAPTPRDLRIQEIKILSDRPVEFASVNRHIEMELTISNKGHGPIEDNESFEVDAAWNLHGSPPNSLAFPIYTTLPSVLAEGQRTITVRGPIAKNEIITVPLSGYYLKPDNHPPQLMDLVTRVDVCDAPPPCSIKETNEKNNTTTKEVSWN